MGIALAPVPSTNPADLVDRLAQHTTLGSAPAEELAWLAARGSLLNFQGGDVVTPKGVRPKGLYVVLSGLIYALTDRTAGARKVFEWKGGDVAGLLPFSRYTSSPGDSVVQEPSDMVLMDGEDMPALIRDCPCITAILVAAMLDRARYFHSVELREARNEAEKANRAKSEFLARMSHEIRTPLNAVIGMADVLASGPLSPHQRKCVEISQRNGIGLLHLINDILDLAKVESGKVELEATEFDLRDVLAEAAEVVETRASSKGLWLRQAIDPAAPVYLIGDPNRLRQVLINLLGNSIKFTETGGLEVRVGVDPENPEAGRLRFAVADTGIGIEPEKVDHVFESFAQADVSTTRKYGGSGLGLTISKELVQLMGGRVWVESTPGAGTTFFFTAGFTVQENPVGRTEEKSQTPDQLERQLAGMRLLVADDSDDNRFLVGAYLKGIPCSIDTAENGAEAVELFKKNGYDVVLMDGEMPVMDGYAATREIRRFESECRPPEEATPILAFTANALTDMAAGAEEAGFTDVLTKPIRKLTLLEALARYRKAVPAPTAAGVSEAVPAADIEATRILVRVEPDLRDVVPAYLEKRKADVAACQAALIAGDLIAIQRVAHKMKGTGTGYGFPFLTETGAVLEAAAHAGHTDEIRERLGELASWFEKVEIES